MAFLIGGADPLKLLATHPDDWPVLSAVLDKAIEIDNERRKNMMRSLIEGIGTMTGNRVAEVLANAMR